MALISERMECGKKYLTAPALSERPDYINHQIQLASNQVKSICRWLAVISFRDYVVHAVAVLTMVGVTASARHVSPSEQTDIIVYEHAPDAIAPWPVLDVYLLDTEGRKPRALTTDGHSHTPSWSPDGQRILFIHDNALHAKARKTADIESHYPVE